MEVEAKAALNSIGEEIGDIRNHVIIAGFGRVGQLVARLLAERMIPYVAIDIDMERVHQGRTRGLPVFYGDARRPDVMRALGIQRARMAVICVNETKNALRSAMMVHRHFPHVKICVRMRDDEYEDKFTKIGATVVVPENLEPSLQLASVVLRTMGATEDEANQIIDNYRHSLATRREQKMEEAGV
jgi:CPA2 family monovalent cation:H+ antiporter-2